MDFGKALAFLEEGARLQREGWNGKDMFIYLVPAAAYPAQRGAAKRWAGEDAMIEYGAYLAMKTAQGNVVPWLASQTDILAKDWDVYPGDSESLPPYIGVEFNKASDSTNPFGSDDSE